jgi:N-acetyl-anhydromuramyl-L-alanine amidase AmpD
MTGVGGLLLIADGSPAPAVQGLTLTPLAATGVSQSIESIFQTRSAVSPGRWTYIVIHHSGSPAGSPASIEQEHVAQRLRGLGHHFVIGNGRGMQDGELHVGRRWLEQLPGAHAAGPKGEAFNLNSISICLVGDGNRHRFTQVQIDRLTQVVSALQTQLGIPPDRVILHSDIAEVADPGRLFPEATFRASLAAKR